MLPNILVTLHPKLGGNDFHLEKVSFISQVSPLSDWLQGGSETCNFKDVNYNCFQSLHLSTLFKLGLAICKIFMNHACLFILELLHSDLCTFLSKIDKWRPMCVSVWVWAGLHYGKESFRSSGGADLHNFISSGFVTLGRGHPKGKHLSLPSSVPSSQGRLNYPLSSSHKWAVI